MSESTRNQELLQSCSKVLHHSFPDLLLLDIRNTDDGSNERNLERLFQDPMHPISLLPPHRHSQTYRSCKQSK